MNPTTKRPPLSPERYALLSSSEYRRAARVIEARLRPVLDAYYARRAAEAAREEHDDDDAAD